jgi:hypothetical protein
MVYKVIFISSIEKVLWALVGEKNEIKNMFCVFLTKRISPDY